MYNNNNNYCSLHDAKFCGIFILLYFSIMLLYPLLIFYIPNFEKVEGHRDNPRMGPDPFCEKTINVLLNWTLFWAGPI